MRKKTNPLLLLFVIVLVVSQACDLPFSEGPAPTLLPTGTAAAEVSQPTTATLPTEVPPEPLPPAIIETIPLHGSTLHLSDGVTLYFNQSMDRDSVEAALQFDPQVAVHLEWLDDETLFIKPEEQLSVSSEFALTIGVSASAASGLPLIKPYSLSYHTAKALQVVERLPRPYGRDVNPAAALAVTFNNPVVPLAAESIEHAPAFTLEPAATGRGEWLNTSTFIFYPDPPLFGGTEYSLKLNTNLVSTSGAQLIFEDNAPSEWTFTTAPPMLISVEPEKAENLPIDSAFKLVFNQPMDRESVEENLYLQDNMGRSVPGGFAWNDDSSELTFQPDVLLSRGTIYQLNLSGQTRALGGTPLGEDHSFSFASVGSLAVQKTIPSLTEYLETHSGITGIRIYFNAPLAEGDISELVSVEPEIGDALIYKPNDKSIQISGYFSASTEYTLTISADIMDRWQGTLGEPYIVPFSTAPASPSLTIPMLQMISSALFLTPDDISIPANVTNLDSINIESYKLSLTDFVELSDSRKLMSGFVNQDVSFWQQSLSLSKNVNQPVDMQVTPQGEPLETGLYLFRVGSSELDTTSKSFLLVVSRVHLVIKRSANELFIWAVDLETNKPIADTVLTIHHTNAALLSNCITDASGICWIDLPDFIKTYDSLYVLTGDPGNDNFGLAEDTWSAGISGWDFGFYTHITKDKLMGYMYTDRPIYRPGQTVNFRVIVRDAENARYTIPDLEQVVVEVMGIYTMEAGESPLLAEIAIPLSEYGSGSSSFTLPEDAPPGYYTLRISEIDDIWLDFQVAEYRKPEIDLQVSFSSQGYLIGQDLQATVQADYYFGVPAGEMDVHWVLFTKPDYLHLPYGYQVGARSLDWFDRGYWRPAYNSLGNYVLEGNGQTDLDGSIVIDLPFDELADEIDPQNIQQFTLEVTIRDQSELPVSVRATASLHPEEFYIGVRPESWTAQAGAELGFGVQTVDWERNIFANQALTASFQKVTWELDWGAVHGIGYPQYLLSFTDISSASFTTDENGQARLVFIPPEPGTYLLEIRQAGAVTQVMSWVGGQGSVAWPNLPNQQLPVIAEADAYRPNQTALIFIPNPFEGDALALVTVERSQVMRKYVFPISSSNYEFPLSLTDADAPNVFVSVTLLGKDADGRPDFRLGYLELEVEPEAQTLNVYMEALPQRSEPGEDVLFSIQVTDHQDNPVQGEFSLALVDKAVLALADPNAPEILEAFYGLQPFGIRNSYTLAAHADRILSVSAEGLGGGGGGPDEVSFIRDDFKDTAFWSGTIETDSDGRAEVRVQLPDNLTTWVANLRGLTVDTRVGETESEVITTKDLLIRPVVPRFLVEGDHVELAAMVHNNTDQQINAEVSLQALGFILDNDDDILQRVGIPAGGQVRVSWWGKVQTGADVELIFAAEAGDLKDAARPEGGDLPVLSYTYPQTFGTSGVLTEAGDWLEVISLPRTFEPDGGELRLEMAPSLAAAILDGLKALEIFPTTFTEPLLSRLLPNIETFRLLQDLSLESPALESKLSEAVLSGVESLSKNQNTDGGWGWIARSESDIHITSYVLFGLSRASNAGVFIEPEILGSAQNYLLDMLVSPGQISQPWQFDRLVFQHFALQQSGIRGLNTEALYDVRDQLNPWARSLLALLLFGSDATRDLSINLIDELKGSASRTATGAHWEDKYPSWRNLTSSNTNTAMVLYVLAQIDPASPLLSEAVRYIVLHRRPQGGWTSSYETAWVLMALTETMKGRGELQADYSFSASLNGEILISGQADGADALTSVSTSIPISELFSGAPNALRVNREAGEGSLYYRAFLQVYQPVDSASPVDRGLSISKRYEIQGLDCGESGCEPVTSVNISDLEGPLLVRLTLTIPEEMHYLVVEDWIPAGAEILDTSLKTSQLGYPLEKPSIDPFNPFSSGWGRWLFGSPQIFDDHVRWIARRVPAGTYELTYQLVPFQTGEYKVIPAHAYQYYFPEVEGSSAGTVLGISP